MADEIPLQNVVRVCKVGQSWRALIGPDCRRGLYADAASPTKALLCLADSMIERGWPLDPTRGPRGLAAHRNVIRLAALSRETPWGHPWSATATAAPGHSRAGLSAPAALAALALSLRSRRHPFSEDFDGRC